MVSLLFASLATVVNVAIEVQLLISSPQFIWSWLWPLLLLLHKRRWWQRRWWVKTTLALASYSSTLVQGTLSLSSWIRIYLYHFWYSWGLINGSGPISFFRPIFFFSGGSGGWIAQQRNFLIIVMISVDDLNNAPWIEGMYFLAAAIYAATILLYWVLRKRWLILSSFYKDPTKSDSSSYFKDNFLAIQWLLVILRVLDYQIQ